MGDVVYIHKSTAEAALLAYGYEKVESGWYVKRTPTDIWLNIAEGYWVKAAPATGSFGGGEAFGRPISIPGYVQVPWKQVGLKASGEPCHPQTDPEMYQWEWPEDYVAFMYENATAGEDNTKVRVVSEDGVVRVEAGVKVVD